MPFPVPLLLALNADPPVVERGVAPAVGATFFATSTWLGLVAAQKQHAPKQCRVCRSNALDEAASAGAWKQRKLPDTLSNVGLAVTPGWALGSLLISGAADHRASGFDALVVVESTMVAMLVNQIVKFEVARRRPDVHHGVVAPGHSPEDNLSFFSGHTTWSFASVVAAGSVASIRGYRGAPAVWAGGLAFAAATGYLRIGAERHWLTDVLVGAAIGGLAGAVIPRLHFASTAATASAATASAAPLGAAPTWITVGGVF